MSSHSKACCTLPPVVTTGYQNKGKFVDINGTKTYVTGPEDAKAGILFVYDIFGYKDQTLQGADILATSDHEQKYQVFVPDMFNGKPADIEWYPPNTKEKESKLGEWFKTTSPPVHLPKLEPFLQDYEKLNSNIKSWGIIGYCWGGKMTSLITGQSDKFKAAVQTSPAMVDPEDAAKVKCPMMMLASKDEPAEDVSKYKESLKVKNHVETFDDQLHGWMSARADLADSGVKKEYERGYQLAVGWFHDHMHKSSKPARL